jgi:hypothetical protein
LPILDISATNGGLLIPRVALVSVTNPIAAPITSLLVWNTSTSGTYPTAGFYYFNGTDWVTFGGATDPSWLLLGNNGTIPGTGAGQNFVGTRDANDLILATNSVNHIQIKANGNLVMNGNFENQEIVGGYTSVGAMAIVEPASVAVATGATVPNATHNWISNSNVCGTCTEAYKQSVIISNNQSEVIEGTTQSITITDGNGVSNSGVLILANVNVKTTGNSSAGSAVRHIIWLQRSTDPLFTSNATNIYRVEDGVAGGIYKIPAVPTLSPGSSTTNIMYPDLNLAAGTYYYRLVYQGVLGAGNGQSAFIQDRSMTILQIKR